MTAKKDIKNTRDSNAVSVESTDLLSDRLRYKNNQPEPTSYRCFEGYC